MIFFCTNLGQKELECERDGLLSRLSEMDKQLQERITKNTSEVQKRFALCSPDLSKNESSPDAAVDRHLRHLLSVAQDDDQICMMPSTFQGWL